jgi:hypothetical protein
VWLAHLLPLLTLREAVTLRATCKALPPIVADLRADLGERPVKHLKAMLTCFPKADTVELQDDHSMTQAEQESLIAWLEERANSLTRVQEDSCVGPFHRRAWRAGVFQGVKHVDLDLDENEDRDLIIDECVSGVESIYVRFEGEDPNAERAAVGYLRHFPTLKAIECSMGLLDMALPPFIPPSLEALTLSLDCAEAVLLLGCLPPMIKSRGPRLRSLDLTFEELVDDATARGVRSLIRSCAPTLKEVTFNVRSSFESAVEVLEGLASCQHLERLSTPINTFAWVPANRSVTFRPSHLCLSASPGDEGVALSRIIALWGLMARGGLPNLTSFTLESEGWVWDADLGPVMVAAFEGVAGTLTTLTLKQCDFEKRVGGRGADGVLQRLGEAIGKLHRLETLTLDIFKQGLAYHRVAQGGRGIVPLPPFADVRHQAGIGVAGMSAQHHPPERASPPRDLRKHGRDSGAGAGVRPDEPRLSWVCHHDECAPRKVGAAGPDPCHPSAARQCEVLLKCHVGCILVPAFKLGLFLLSS